MLICSDIHYYLCLYLLFRSDRPRRAAVVNYIADGVCSDSDDPMMNGIPAIKKVLMFMIMYTLPF